MSVNYPVLNEETAPNDDARERLGQIKKGLGFVPNLYATMSNSPTFLKAYLTLSSIYDETTLSPQEQQVVLLSTSWVNDCHYCMAAHTAIAKGAKVEDDVIEAAREGRAQSDPKLEALRQFALQLVRERGWVDGAPLQAFFDAGFTKQHVLDLITILAQKTISNYVNHIAETPVDRGFQPFAWQEEGANA